jgi:hypothetical protein
MSENDRSGFWRIGVIVGSIALVQAGLRTLSERSVPVSRPTIYAPPPPPQPLPQRGPAPEAAHAPPVANLHLKPPELQLEDPRSKDALRLSRPDLGPSRAPLASAHPATAPPPAVPPGMVVLRRRPARAK